MVKRWALGVGLVFLVACGDGGDFPFPPPGPVVSTPTPVVPVVPTPAVEPVCDRQFGVDGPGGFLWKPKSDTFGGVVVIFPGEFSTQFEKVEVFYGRKGTPIGLSFNGFANPDEVGPRQHWKDRTGKYTGEKLSGEVLVLTKTQVCSWVVEHPEKRQD